MKKITVVNKQLLFLFLLFFLIRLPYLENLNLLHDERDIVLTGYKISKTGYDINGNFLPLNFTNIHPKTPFFSIYYSALWWFFLPYKSVFFARLPFLVSSSFLIFLVYGLIKRITNSDKVALITTVVFCFSPWIFHLTRLALEINLALPIIILAIFLYLSQRKNISLIFFTIVFFTYQGFRPLIPFCILFCELILLLERKVETKFFLKNLILAGLFFLILIFSASLIEGETTNKRLNEIIFFNLEKFSDEVIFRRNTSLSSENVRVLLYNKITVAIDYLLDVLIKGQDLTYLFKKGDYSPINGNVAGGQFFFPMVFFYYLGFIYLGRKNKINYYYPLGIILIGLIPSLINSLSVTFSIRSALSGVGFAYVLSLGIIFFGEIIANLGKKKRFFLLMILGVSLSINFIYFIFNYFYRRPITVGELFFENERQLAVYLINNKKKEKKEKESIAVFHKFPNEAYLSYCFFENKIDIKEVVGDFSNKRSLIINRISFYNCDKKKDYFSHIHSVIFEGCLSQTEYDKLLANNKIKKIPYRDYSNKIAYFIFKK